MNNLSHKVRILVLGDIGRSPRMTNHCLSFINEGWEVYFSGYLQTELSSKLTSNEMIHIERVKAPSVFFEKRKKIKLFLIMKVLITAFYLLTHLLFCEWTPVLLIQNPPAMPTFFIAWFISKVRRIQLMIDWHNYGHTIMNAESSSKGFLNRFYKFVELKFSKKMNAVNFCVSKALKNDMLLKWNIESSVLYDLPWQINTDRDVTLFHNLFLKLGEDFPILLNADDDSKTFLTERMVDGECRFRKDRPALIVSSCSWTIDDDFETLFKALDLYNERIVGGEQLPDILCVITGKGPLKAYFSSLVAGQSWSHVTVLLPWLAADDYPVLLRAGDLGLCLHRSTSGLDLPMKAVDMLAAGLPILALNYRCMHELVVDRANGRLFASAVGLCGHLGELLAEAGADDLATFRRNIAAGDRRGLWHEHWRTVVLPQLTGRWSE